MKILSRASQVVSNPSYLQIPYKNPSDVRFIPPDDDAALVSSHAAAAPRTDWRAPRTRQHPGQPQHGRRYRLRAQRPSKIALQLRFWRDQRNLACNFARARGTTRASSDKRDQEIVGLDIGFPSNASDSS